MSLLFSNILSKFVIAVKYRVILFPPVKIILPGLNMAIVNLDPESGSSNFKFIPGYLLGLYEYLFI